MSERNIASTVTFKYAIKVNVQGDLDESKQQSGKPVCLTF